MRRFPSCFVATYMADLDGTALGERRPRSLRAIQLGMPIFEASVETGEHVKDAFFEVVREKRRMAKDNSPKKKWRLRRC